MNDYTIVASEDEIATAKKALESNNFIVHVVAHKQAAKAKVLQLIPEGQEVFTATSRTLAELGLEELFNKSGAYDAVKPKLAAFAKDPSKRRQQRQLGAAPEYAVGSVHAVTQDGHVAIASQTGSQLPAYLYGAEHVVWIVGAQKIVKDIAEADERIRAYVLPLEDKRAKAAYGTGSAINKLVHFYKEAQEGRVHLVLVKEALGF